MQVRINGRSSKLSGYDNKMNPTGNRDPGAKGHRFRRQAVVRPTVPRPDRADDF